MKFLLAFVAAAAALQVPPGKKAVSNISQCPKLSSRGTATNVNDLRPDQIEVVAAIGDSITAAFAADGGVNENRGLTYSVGGKAGAITTANLLKYYNPNIKGTSNQDTSVSFCYGVFCPGSSSYNPQTFQLNAGLSGALAANLDPQVAYLGTAMTALGISKNSWKWINLQISSNDQCLYCDAASGVGTGNQVEFGNYIRKALNGLKSTIGNAVVNLDGAFNVSRVYGLNQANMLQCFGKFVSVECGCAFRDQNGRNNMDKLVQQYNQQLVQIAKEFQSANSNTFGVVWQPVNVPLESWPIKALSTFDCFHPSVAAHQLLGKYLYNSLTIQDYQYKKQLLSWDDNLPVVCVDESDRFPTKNAIGLSGP